MSAQWDLPSLLEIVWPGQAARHAQITDAGFSSITELWRALVSPVSEHDPREDRRHLFNGVHVQLNQTLLACHDHSGALFTTQELEQLHALMTDRRVSQICPKGDIAPAVVFTAPHGVWVHRDGQPDHKPEDYTTFLAQDMAEVVGGRCVSWSGAEIAKSKRSSKPDALNRDPNYLSDCEHRTNPWNRALEAHCGMARATRDELVLCVHFDVHGRRDYEGSIGNDQSDLDIGVGALQRMNPELAAEVSRLLCEAVQPVLGTKWKVNGNPQLQGCCAAKLHRMTLTQQSVAMGAIGVQLEFSLRLRKMLNQERALRHRVAAALVRAVDGVWDSGVPLGMIFGQCNGAPAELEPGNSTLGGDEVVASRSALQPTLDS
eukprot:TRINITY_DN18718_c0_g1_i1.p1 TRINITY_DN18718_c0_g1~~TRINITY_DN18718_c0_g1_i1.p1  ORF type:complete len:375 (+),score=65.10 TRINITY_DN18718_c0_g1_i1:224-1348(+)